MSIPYIQLKCGCSGVGLDIPKLFMNHEVSILGSDEGRRKKILCEDTGKFWFVELPDLVEI